MHGPVSLLAVVVICIVAGIIYLVGLGVYRAIRWLKENL